MLSEKILSGNPETAGSSGGNAATNSSPFDTAVSDNGVSHSDVLPCSPLGGVLCGQLPAGAFRVPGKATRVRVVVPLYKPALDAAERLSLAHNAQVLHRYPHSLLVPEGMPTEGVLSALPKGLDLSVVEVGTHWLGRENGIAGYNRMMLSGEFYDLFAACDYILVCQTDVWVFRDSLALWCDEGYDYVGAPWVKRRIYSNPLIACYLALRRRLFERGLRLLRQSLFDKVGNGGLSLRRVEACRRACAEYAGEAEYFLSHSGHLYNEDVFWAVVPRGFRYPDVRRALDFAFDTNPAYCYALKNGRLPFGCHAWSKPRYLRFWRRFIPFDRP